MREKTSSFGGSVDSSAEGRETRASLSAPVASPEAPHLVGRLLCSSAARARWARRLLLLLGAVLGVLALRGPLATLAPGVVEQKDFLQEYFLARAVAEGTTPYAPMTELAARYLGTVPSFVWPHPTPHPPTAGVLLLPLALLDYPTAATVWLAIQALSLVAAAHFLLTTERRLVPIWLSGLVALALVPWFPVWFDLTFGQVMVVILALLAGARKALLADRPALAGLLVGTALLLKPTCWPVLAVFLLRGQRRALMVGVGTVLAGYVASAALLGLGPIHDYVTRVLPEVNALYRSPATNISLWTLGWRAFSGTGSDVIVSFTALPLLGCQAGARLFSAAVPGAALLASCLAARRLASTDAAFGLMVSISILVSPIAWGHYLVLAAVPAAYAAGWLANRGFPRRETNGAILVLALLLVSDGLWTQLAFAVAGQTPTALEEAVLPFWAALLSLGPALAVGAMIWLASSLNRRR